MTYLTDSAIKSLYEAQVSYKHMVKASSIKTRKNWLKNLRDAIIRYESDIKDALYADFRKNPIESDTTEIFATLIEIKEFLKNLDKWAKPKRVKSPILFKTIAGKLLYEPKGNTLIITPWNYPFQLPMVHLVASVAAGNTVILKLSEFSTHINQVIKKIISQIFAPEHVCVVEGEVEQTTQLLSLKFDHIHFTGSPAVGKIVMAAASKHLSDITLELGGKSPTFIDHSVDVREVVKNLIWAKFVNMGQTCIAPDYLLIDKRLETTFEEIFKEEVTKAFGQEMILSKDLARIINRKQYDRLSKALEELESTSTTWIVKGEHNPHELFIHPTLLKNMPLDATIMQEEIFGPIFPIVYYSKLEDAFELVNSKEKPLALYIFSKDNQYIQQVLNNTTAGGTTINDAMVHILHPNLPFGGVNHSGIGQSLGIYGFRDFSHERAVAEVKLFPMTKFFWYPYTTRTGQIVQLMKKYFT